jgi:hypothetical protein
MNTTADTAARTARDIAAIMNGIADAIASGRPAYLVIDDGAVAIETAETAARDWDHDGDAGLIRMEDLAMGDNGCVGDAVYPIHEAPDAAMRAVLEHYMG